MVLSSVNSLTALSSKKVRETEEAGFAHSPTSTKNKLATQLFKSFGLPQGSEFCRTMARSSVSALPPLLGI